MPSDTPEGEVIAQVTFDGAEEEPFGEVCRAVHAQLGGRASAEETARAVYEAIGDDRYRRLTWPSFVEKVRSELRKPDAATKLPYAAAIDGQYVQRSLWDVEDYRFAIADHMRRARVERQRAYDYARECRDRYDVWIDPASVLPEEDGPAAANTS